MINGNYAMGTGILLNNRILTSAIDGWVEDLLMDGDDFDCNDLVEEVESVAYKHAKYSNYPLLDAVKLLDRVENWRRRFDLDDKDRRELSPTGSSPSPVFT
jgi:hypothetical protein